MYVKCLALARREYIISTSTHLVLLHFALSHFTDIAFIFFLQIEGLWPPCIEQVYQHHFSKSICSLCVSVSHFANSYNISSFFIIIILVMVSCGQ